MSMTNNIAAATGVVAATGVIAGAAHGSRKLADRLTEQRRVSGDPSADTRRAQGALAFTGIATAAAVAFSGLGAMMLADRGRLSQFARPLQPAAATAFAIKALQAGAWAAIPLGLTAMVGVALLDR